jgi:hypothetical protein
MKKMRNMYRILKEGNLLETSLGRLRMAWPDGPYGERQSECKVEEMLLDRF